MKVCSKCKLEQNESEYLPNRSCKDGLTKDCISCKAKESGMTKDDYLWKYLCRGSSSAYYERNKDKEKQRAEKWARENPERSAEQSRKFYSKNKDTYKEHAKRRKEISRNLDYQWTLEMEQAIRGLFPCCVVCGKTEEQNMIEEGKRLHVDHVLPLSKGYGLSPGNAVILCGKCNRAKLDKDLEELMDGVREKIELSAEKFKRFWSGNF